MEEKKSSAAVSGNNDTEELKSLRVKDETFNLQLEGKSFETDKGDDVGVVVRDGDKEDANQPLIYNVLDKPPIHLLIMFAIQQCLVSIHAPLTCTALVAEVVCARNDDVIKTQILSATNLMVGLATILMTTVGVRLPIFQGPSPIYLLNFVAMANMAEWKCPPVSHVLDPSTNITMPYAVLGNDTLVPQRELILQRIQALSGSLIAAGCLHFLIGITGLVGVITRYVGPITIVPPILLVGLNFYSITVEFCETNWTVAIITTSTCFILSLYLGKRQTPIPFWNRSKGFHIFWYPLHQVFAILIGLLVGWIASAIATSIDGGSSHTDMGGGNSTDTKSPSEIIDAIDWFIFPYPGKLGTSYSFNLNAFVNFTMITFLSVLDSIADYSLSARIARIPMPPRFAFNRGLAVEGLMCTLSGFMGSCHATISYGSNVAVMGITRVVSLRVFQALGVFFIIFSILGKLGAIFITVPYSVIGGIQIISFGIFIGIVISYLQTIDLNSNRNLTIIGTAMLLGFMMPYWVKKKSHGIQTGLPDVDDLLNILLSNSAFVGGIVAFLFDNTIPGSLRERGLLSSRRSHYDDASEEDRQRYHVYRIPSLPDTIRRSMFARIIPIFDKVMEARL